MSLYKLLQKRFKNIDITKGEAPKEEKLSEPPLELLEDGDTVIDSAKEAESPEHLQTLDIGVLARAIVSYGEKHNERMKIADMKKNYITKRDSLKNIKTLEELEGYNEDLTLEVDDEHFIKCLGDYVSKLTELNFKKFGIALEVFSVKNVYTMSKDDTTFVSNVVKYFFLQRKSSLKNARRRTPESDKEFLEYAALEAKMLIEYLLKLLGGGK